MQNIVVIRPILEKAEPAVFLVLFINDLNLHININIIDKINTIENIITTIKQP